MTTENRIERRALCIGISTFRSGPCEDTLEDAEWQALPFAASRVTALAESLATVGYRCDVISSELLSAEALGRSVLDVIHTDAVEDVRIVHVLSHGLRADQTGKLYVVGSDGRHHSLSDVESWLSAVEDFDDRPYTLFLLDLCQAGTAARLPWQLELGDGSGRAWVIAAAAPHEAALNGRFTLATTQVLRALAAGDIDVHQLHPYVPLSTIAQEIKRRVIELGKNARGLRQMVTASVMDIAGDPKCPFFPNPKYQGASSNSLRLGLDPALAAFLDDLDLDEILDSPHFLDRAAGRGPLSARVPVGCFTGRAEQLQVLSARFDQRLDRPGVCVVTGSPGTGKSALLGVMVCAAHPALRENFRTVWEHVPGAAKENPWVVAVHARQRPLQQVVESLLRQLRMYEVDAKPELFCSAITSLPEQPVIVLDALDEALSPLSLMNDLLLPLIAARRDDGRPACRMVIGMRPWVDMLPLRHAAIESGMLVDLDAVPREQVRTDVIRYVERLTENCLPYCNDRYLAVRSAFSEAVARVLTDDTILQEQRWGEFLVAGLYTNHVIDRKDTMEDATEAAAIGSQVPRTLPEVLDLDLAMRPNSSLLRPILATLAFARGNGMPVEILRRIVPALMPADNRYRPISREQINATLDIVRFYLRTAPDSDATTLYRLFHQGLVDHLRTHPLRGAGRMDPQLPSRVLSLLLSPLPWTEEGRWGWSAARPYTLRHAIQHAYEAGRTDELLVDPEFLIRADPVFLFPELDHARSPEARVSAIVYRTSAHVHGSLSQRERQQILAVDAARCHVVQFCQKIATVPASPPIIWRPVLAQDGGSDTPPVTLSTANTGDVYAVACTRLEGRWLVVSGHGDAGVRLWDVMTGYRVGHTMRGHTDGVRAIACAVLDGRAVVVTGSADGTARIWDLATQQPVGQPLKGHTDWVRGVACAVLDGRAVVVTGSADGTARIWDLATQQPVGQPLKGHAGAVRDVASTRLHNKAVVVTGGADGTARIWDLATQQPVGQPLTGHVGGVWTVACGSAAGESVLMTGSSDASVRMWNLRDGRLRHPPGVGHSSWVSAVAYVDGDQPMAVSASGDGTIQVWDVHTGAPVGAPLSLHTVTVGALASGSTRKPAVVFLGVSDGTVRQMEPATGNRAGPSLKIIKGRLLHLLHALTFGKRQVLLAVADDGTFHTWDLDKGCPAEVPAIPHQAAISALTTFTMAERHLLITATHEGTFHTWDLDKGCPAEVPAIPHQAAISALTTFTMAERHLLITATHEGTFHTWDLDKGSDLRQRAQDHCLRWVSSVGAGR